MRVYAVIDTNVLVSSLLTKNPNSPTAKVVDAVASGDIIPLYSKSILEEYHDVLNRPKFPFTEKSTRRLIDMFCDVGVPVDPKPTGETLPDMDDLVFYEVVMEKRDENAYLVTGNIKHFPARHYIVTPAEMMEILAS